ncbi:hypothetical protein HPB48_020740 [Haemaphysalis longicornis]|uniref:Uncharacterized protein n=1 Tax=Haemaphysalis longicornis TaxID=44386 RepID=A0A9J6FY90_HAELO|nr:hypothetical protein HPB48_020740 [Haemaphysalis longicornis]
MVKALIKVMLNTTSAMMNYIVDLPWAEDFAHPLHRLQTTLKQAQIQQRTMQQNHSKDIQRAPPAAIPSILQWNCNGMPPHLPENTAAANEV